MVLPRHGERASNMKLVHEFQILGGGLGYLGMLFGYETENGLRFTHTIANHGAPMFETTQAATDDFYATKARLPQAVHDMIFGKAA